MIGLLNLALVLAQWFAAAPVPPSGPRSLEHCPERISCSYGMCTQTARGCRAGSDTDCRLGVRCADHGACRFNPTTSECEQVPVDACAQSPACPVSGACVGYAAVEEYCTATDATCAASVACRHRGLCHAYQRYGCIVREGDCERSGGCRVEGRCQQGTSAGDADSVPPVTFCIESVDGCARSRQCRTHGLCAFDERSVRCASTAASCRASTVCQQLGWCEPEQGRGPAVTGLWDGVERRDAACYAATCEGTPPCERWGACHTDPLGGCVVAPQEPVPCQTHRVLGLTATATSERAPDGQHYDAGCLVDRDSRTAWVAAEGKAAGETVTIRLPRPERVTRVYIRNSHELQDPTRGDLREHFGRIIHAVVRAGATVEMFNDVRTGVIGPPERYGIPVVLPPTLTDTVTIEVQLVSAGYERAEPAITEVVIEACDAPEAPPAPRSP